MIPHEVKINVHLPRGLPKQMKSGQDVNTQMRSGTGCSR